MIRLSIDTTNFNRIKINNGNDTNRLLDVEQWGGVHWISMENAFYGCSNLNCTAFDLPDWTNVNSMRYMFGECSSLNGPININFWNMSNVTDMEGLFFFASAFNQPLGFWNTSNVTNMRTMFSTASAFNQSLNSWNTSNVINMDMMFTAAINFNQPIGMWNTSKVTNMKSMFSYASNFNQSIEFWNTSQVADMSWMFHNATNFNQPIGNWNTSNVNNMSNMFAGASQFNQYIGQWNTGNVENMNSMFVGAGNFNKDISSWNTAKVKDFYMMFYGATNFNQTIGNWNTSSVTDMNYMFIDASNFNQSLHSWDLSNVSSLYSIFKSSGIDCYNYSNTLKGWNSNPMTPNNLQLGLVTGMKYGLNAVSARDSLINVKGWTITGDTLVNQSCNPFPISVSSTEKDAAVNFTIYPNPTKGKLYVNIGSVNVEPQTNIEIYNTLGQLLFTKDINPHTQTELDVSHLAKGIYYLRVGHVVAKVIVE
jgi:surface protein